MTHQPIIPMNQPDTPPFSEPIKAEIRRTRQAISRYSCSPQERLNSLAQFDRDIEEVKDLEATDGKPAAAIIVCRAIPSFLLSSALL